MVIDVLSFCFLPWNVRIKIGVNVLALNRMVIRFFLVDKLAVSSRIVACQRLIVPSPILAASDAEMFAGVKSEGESLSLQSCLCLHGMVWLSVSDDVVQLWWLKWRSVEFPTQYRDFVVCCWLFVQHREIPFLRSILTW